LGPFIASEKVSYHSKQDRLRIGTDALADDEIDGMTIPADSTIILNVWALHHDEKRWESPKDFVPERYEAYPALAPVYAASKDFADRDHLGYGASRRICPAIHLAERNLFIATAKLLWAFDITADPDAIPDGNANTGSSTGFMQCVKNYDCKIQIRSEAKRTTVGEEFLAAQEIFKAYE
jgi:cytochrome P450